MGSGGRGVLVGAALALWAFAPTAPAAGAEAGTEAEGFVSVVVRDGRVSVAARDAPLDGILGRIAEQAAFRLETKQGPYPRITWTLDGIPVAVAVERLLGRVPHVLVFSDDGALVAAHLLRLAARDQAPEAEVARSASRAARGGGAGIAAGDEAGLALDRLDGAAAIGRLRRLVRRPDAAAVADLAVLARDDEDPVVRAMAAIGLGRLRVEAAKDGLLGALADDSTLVRLRAVQGLGRLWGAEAAAHLAPLVLDDPEPAVRRAAVLALAGVPDEDAVAILDEARFDADASVRRAAIHGLAEARLGVPE